jgi:DNA-binding NarL/FixJ family response regulator
MISIVIADDQAAFRRGLRALLSTVRGVQVVGEAADGREAVTLAARLKPDVVLMDLRMPTMDGVAATRELRTTVPDVKILVLTTFDDDELVRSAIDAGAAGYVLKDTPADDLADLIRITRKGYSSFAPGLVRGDAAVRADDVLATIPASLTPRERDVLRELATGATNREIAAALGLGEGTVRNYVTRILSQLNLRTRTEAALFARARM